MNIARPRKDPDKVRDKVIPLRFTNEEWHSIREMAAAADLTAAEYMRRTLTKRRPRPVPERKAALTDLLYALQKIATNLRQLEEATGHAVYGQWAQYVGGKIVERVLDRMDLLPLMTNSTPLIHEVGEHVNMLARKANSDQLLKDEDVTFILDQLKSILQPLHNAISSDPPPPDDKR